MKGRQETGRNGQDLERFIHVPIPLGQYFGILTGLQEGLSQVECPNDGRPEIFFGRRAGSVLQGPYHVLDVLGDLVSL